MSGKLCTSLNEQKFEIYFFGQKFIVDSFLHNLTIFLVNSKCKRSLSMTSVIGSMISVTLWFL